MLFLTGYRGTGKSRVAKELSSLLGWPAADLDQLIQAADGRPISEIFASEGEVGFRDRESRALAALIEQGGDRVVALGGGAILRAENRQRIRRAGPVVWLTASPPIIWSRLTADPQTASQRPNLTPAGGIAEIIAILDARVPLYREMADLELNTETSAPSELAARIAEWLKLGPSRS